MSFINGFALNFNFQREVMTGQHLSNKVLAMNDRLIKFSIQLLFLKLALIQLYNINKWLALIVHLLTAGALYYKYILS